MVAHLVHRDREGWIAVVAVMLVEGTANPLFETVLDQVPADKGVVRTSLFRRVNATALVPAQTHYFALNGSLTTPPCSEGVRWLVMRESVTVSHEQLARFARLFNGNVRLPQALGGRVVQAGG
jgi:carbonic anhydrase